MGVFDQGGGGGIAGSIVESDELALDQTYDLYGSPSSIMVGQIDEMFRTVFAALRRFRSQLADLTERVTDLEAAGGGGELKIASESLNHTQLLALQTTHVEIVPAVSGDTHVPWMMSMTKPVYVAGYFSNMAIDIVYADDGAETSLITGTFNATATAAAYSQRIVVSFLMPSFAAQTGSALDISSTTANADGDAANTLLINLWYMSFTG